MKPQTPTVWRASNMSRAMVCRNSVDLLGLVPSSSSSEFAKLGTCAHWVGEQCLKLDMTADRFAQRFGVEQTITMDEDTEHEHQHTFTIDDDMIFAVNQYYQYVGGICNQDKDTEKLLETRIWLDHISEDMTGSADCILIQKNRGVVYVIDYKHGVGVPVDLARSKQIPFYALGVLRRLMEEGWLLEEITKLVLVVVQPRCQHGDKLQEMEIEDVGGFYDTWTDAFTKAYKAEAGYKVSKECIWCDAKVSFFGGEYQVCPAVYQEFINMSNKPKPTKLTPYQIANAIEVSGAVNAFTKQLYMVGKAQAESGNRIPRHKLVQSGKSVRSWRDEVKARQILGTVCTSIYADRKLKSPAQIEKFISKEVYKKVVEPLVYKPAKTGTKLVGEDEKGIEIKTAVQDFEEELKEPEITETDEESLW